MRHAALILTCIALVSCGRETDRPIVVASAGPWRQPNGLMHKRGVELAIAEINANGGVRGKQVRLIEADDEASGARAAAIAAEFVANDSILAVIGHVNSGAMTAAARVYDGRLPAISSTASSPELTGISTWTFRVIQSDSVSADHLARFAASLGARRAAVLYENNSFGRGLAGAFRRNFPGTLVTFDPIPMRGDEVYEPHVAYLKVRRPDIVFVGGSEESGLAILREAKRQRVDVPFISGVGWAGIIADTAASEGAYVGVPFTPTDIRPEARRFVQAFQQKFGTTPDAKAALAYDATMLAARAIAEAGPNRRAIRDWLRRLNGDRAFVGLTSPKVQFDAGGDVIGGGFVMTQARAGDLIAQ